MTAERKGLRCPQCGTLVKEYRNPFPTVDVIIERGEGIVLILRHNEPREWALPGGYCDYEESLEKAAIRESKEETSLEIEIVEQFHTYSDPQRDPRQHNITTVYIANAKGGNLQARDDAQQIGIFTEATLPPKLAFDHDRTLRDYFRYKKTGRRILL